MTGKFRVWLHLGLMLTLLAVFLPAPTARAAATGSLSPNSIDFGDQQVGTTSPVKTVTLTNTGDAPLTLRNWYFRGSGRLYFGQRNLQGSCQFYNTPPLEPGASCAIGFTYRPTVAGRHSMQVVLQTSAPGGELTIDLSGTGVVPPGVPVVSQDRQWLSFEMQETGTTSAPRNITITNLGNVALTISGISIVDGYVAGSAASFAQSNTCGAMLAAGASCTIGVAFAPAVTERLNATLRIDDGANGSPHTLSLWGEGTSPGACFAVEITGKCMNARFYAYWKAHGELAINGYPLSSVTYEVLRDGNFYEVQYFERVRMEYHRNEPDPRFKVQLGQFGRQILAGLPDAPTAAAAPRDGYTFVDRTGHNVRPEFWAYFTRFKGGAAAGLEQFGYPLSEEFEQQLEDGNTYTVQYFERARMEWHPEANNGQGGVILGQFGRQICGSRCR